MDEIINIVGGIAERHLRCSQLCRRRCVNIENCLITKNHTEREKLCVLCFCDYSFSVEIVCIYSIVDSSPILLVLIIFP